MMPSIASSAVSGSTTPPRSWLRSASPRRRKALPTYCFAGLRRLSPEAQQQAALQIRSLSELNDMDDRAKAVALGLTIMSLTGKPILKKGVDQLGDRIIGTPPAV